jgi:hypothetical protein
MKEAKYGLQMYLDFETIQTIEKVAKEKGCSSAEAFDYLVRLGYKYLKTVEGMKLAKKV